MYRALTRKIYMYAIHLSFDKSWIKVCKSNIPNDADDIRKKFVTNNIKWNFTKFLLDQSGNVVDRSATVTHAISLAPKIKELIEKAPKSSNEEL